VPPAATPASSLLAGCLFCSALSFCASAAAPHATSHQVTLCSHECASLGVLLVSAQLIRRFCSEHGQAQTALSVYDWMRAPAGVGGAGLAPTVYTYTAAMRPAPGSWPAGQSPRRWEDAQAASCPMDCRLCITFIEVGVNWLALQLTTAAADLATLCSAAQLLSQVFNSTTVRVQAPPCVTIHLPGMSGKGKAQDRRVSPTAFERAQKAS